MNVQVPPEYRELFDRICKTLQFEDPPLLSAIIQVESAWNPWACRYEPAFKNISRPDFWSAQNHETQDTESQLQRCSWGLMQIMGATARYCGYGGALPKLCDPETGISWGAVYLKRLLIRYRENVEDVIAAYNAGSAVQDAPGHYRNQAYVDKVRAVLAPMRSSASG